MRASAAAFYAFLLAAVVGLGGYFAGRLFLNPPAVVEEGSGWTEVAWPFLRDGWPKGRAFRCGISDCGEEVLVYARIKMGLCDCTAGVASDDDLERISDAGLIAQELRAEAPGVGQRFAGMSGWTRSYRMGNGSALQIYGGGRNCNAFVGMASARSELTPRARQAVDRLLNGRQMADWIASAQGMPQLH